MTITFYTLAPSPHLEGTLNAVHRHDAVDLRVAYEKKHLEERDWGLHPGEAPHTYLGSWDLTGHGQHVSPKIGSAFWEEAPDLVVVSTSYVSLNTYSLIWQALRRDIPFVFWAERVSRRSSSLVRWARRPFLRWILRRAAGFVGPTRDTVRFYRSEFGYSGPATWVPYHRDLGPFLKLPVRTEPPRTVRFLVLGALNTGKGIDTVLRALAAVERPAELVVVGDGPERASLEALADACRPRHRVQFRSAVSYEAVPSLMKTADVLLFPSRHDGFGMVTMEALAAGRPVVASEAVMSAREYVRLGTNGWLLPVDDVSVWARRMENIIENRDQLPAWSRAARQTVCSCYRVEDDVTRLVDLLHDVRAPSAASHG